MNYRKFLWLPHLDIQHANAMSSPYTIGFPAMTAWLGAVHALQRKIQDAGLMHLSFPRMAISCHQFHLHAYKGERDFVSSIVGMVHPLTKTGERAPFVEEPRCHLNVSLLIELQGHHSDDSELLMAQLNECIPCMKWAGGDLNVASLSRFDDKHLIVVDEDNEQDVRKLLHKLMLGVVLVERRHLMQKAMQEGQEPLTALLDYLSVEYRAIQKGDKVFWNAQRKETGWLVPIAVGFQGISALGQAEHQRDPNVPHRFAESVVTLGEFIMPYRIKKLDEMLWHYQADLERDLYLCQTTTQYDVYV